MAEAPIFVVGCPRSGTGMLRDLLRSHSRISFPPESHFIPRLYRGWGDPGSAEEARATGGRILSLATVRRWEVGLEPADFEECRTYAGCVDLIYGNYAARQGKQRWGDKTPQYVSRIPTLAEVFPGARFIHIIRDGRDVALSWLRRPHGPQNLYSAARTWQSFVAIGRRDGAALGGAYAEVRYEALLADPEPEMRRLCEFIGESWEPGLLKPAPRSPRYLSRSAKGQGFHNRAEVERDNSGRWRSAMSPEQRSLFESVAAPMLSDLGYETEGLARPLTAPRRAVWWLDNLIRTVAAKRKFTQFSPADAALLLRGELRRRLPRGARGG